MKRLECVDIVLIVIFVLGLFVACLGLIGLILVLNGASYGAGFG